MTKPEITGILSYMNPKLHFEGLPEPQKRLWDKLVQQSWLEYFYIRYMFY